jgi:hypothetical protein
MKTNHSYEFISRFIDIDLKRIIKEAPENSPFILIESRDRTSNKPLAWVLLVSLLILKDERTNDLVLANDFISPLWGNRSLYKNNLDIIYVANLGYRAITKLGKFPGKCKQEIENIKAVMNQKDTITTVSFK